MNPAHRQGAHRVRLEWGPTGATAIGESDIAVVVDVLSFTTTLAIAVERGIEVLPFAWKDERAAQYAATNDAALAVGRLEGRDRPGTANLSPASMLAVTGIERLVLPSPNGSTIAAALATTGTTVVGGSLRNAAALAAWLAPQVAAGATVAVVPAGERWPDDTLRPAVEDLWGAGAILSGLLAMLPDPADLSPEAALAVAAYDVVAGELPAALAACASGRELVEAGFTDDVEVAAALDGSPIVPVLVDGRFLEARA